jgi:hypothetical protein
MKCNEIVWGVGWVSSWRARRWCAAVAGGAGPRVGGRAWGFFSVVCPPAVGVAGARLAGACSSPRARCRVCLGVWLLPPSRSEALGGPGGAERPPGKVTGEPVRRPPWWPGASSGVRGKKGWAVLAPVWSIPSLRRALAQPGRSVPVTAQRLDPGHVFRPGLTGAGRSGSLRVGEGAGGPGRVRPTPTHRPAGGRRRGRTRNQPRATPAGERLHRKRRSLQF